MGASMYHWLKHGELRAEGTSITEGIGQGRVTANIEGAPIDDAYQIPDDEALPIVFDLLLEEGCVWAAQAALILPVPCTWRAIWARPHDCHDFVRFRHALSEQIVQSGFFERKGPARPILAVKNLTWL